MSVTDVVFRYRIESPMPDPRCRFVYRHGNVVELTEVSGYAGQLVPRWVVEGVSPELWRASTWDMLTLDEVYDTVRRQAQSLRNYRQPVHLWSKTW